MMMMCTRVRCTVAEEEGSGDISEGAGRCPHIICFALLCFSLIFDISFPK